MRIICPLFRVDWRYSRIDPEYLIGALGSGLLPFHITYLSLTNDTAHDGSIRNKTSRSQFLLLTQAVSRAHHRVAKQRSRITLEVGIPTRIVYQLPIMQREHPLSEAGQEIAVVRYR